MFCFITATTDGDRLQPPTSSRHQSRHILQLLIFFNHFCYWISTMSLSRRRGSLQPGRKAKPLQRASLITLSNELLQEIFRHLNEDPVTRAAFAFCHPIVLRAVGNTAFASLRAFRVDAEHTLGCYYCSPCTREKSQKLWFRWLQVVKRDLPGSWICESCMIIHPQLGSKSLSSPRLLLQSPSHPLNTLLGFTVVGPENSSKSCRVYINMEVVEQVMRWHQKGRKSRCATEILFCERHAETSGLSVDRIIDVTAEAVIRGCELIWNAKYQYTWITSAESALDVYEALEETGFVFCHHLRWHRGATPSIALRFQEYLWCRLRHRFHENKEAKPTTKKLCNFCKTVTFQCSSCTTEVDLYLVNPESRTSEAISSPLRYNVTINIWKNFGSCKEGDYAELRKHFDPDQLYVLSPRQDLDPRGIAHQRYYLPCEHTPTPRAEAWPALDIVGLPTGFPQYQFTRNLFGPTRL
jgi:hypothetical protein